MAAFTSRRRRVHELLETAQPGDRLSAVVDVVVSTIIVLNIAAVALDTVDSIHARWGGWLALFEVVSVAVFTVEYVLRLWSATVEPGYERPFVGRLRYALRPMLLVDLVAILPTYLGPFFPLDLRFVRVLRLLRIVKLTRHSPSLKLVAEVIRDKRSELGLAYFVLLVTLLLVSSLMYFAENAAQPDVFTSIPAAMWWGTVTIATVGYGDVVPVTVLGKILGIFVILAAITVYALPVAILTSGFTEALQRRSATAQRTCPHCGEQLH